MPHDAIFVGYHRGNIYKRAVALYTNTHMEDISVANGQGDLTKAQSKKDSLLKVLAQPNSANLLQVSPVHLWLLECAALGGVTIWEQAAWSVIFPPTKNLWQMKRWFGIRTLKHAESLGKTKCTELLI